MNRSRTSRAVLALASVATIIGLGQGTATAHTTVTAASGAGFGYWSDQITLFGGAQADFGPAPAATWPSPQNASVNTARVFYGPATLFTSDDIAITTSGTTGNTGSSTSTSSILNVNYAATQTTTGSEIFGYPPPETDPLSIDFNPNNLHTGVAATATANGAGATGSTTITNGILRTHHQASTDCPNYDTTPCGRADDLHLHSATNPEGVVQIPTNPPANYTIAGHLHLNGTVDYFVVVFNQQTANANGSITVTPVHEYFGYKLVNGQIVEDLSSAQGGSTLHGHLYLGQVTAGVTTQLVNSPPVANDDPNYTTDYQTPLTRTAAQGVLANDSDPDGDTFTAGGATNPPGGSVTLASDGSFTYTPDNGFTGNDTFSYTTTDAHGATDTATVTVAVGPPPPLPMADLSVDASGPLTTPISTRKVPSSGSYTFTVTNAGPEVANGATLSVSTSGARVSYGTITPSTGTCTVSKGKTKVVTCNFGNLAVGGTPPTVTIVVSAPTKPSSMTIAGTVSTASSDTNGANNSNSVTTSYFRP